LAVNYMHQSFTPPPVERTEVTSRPEGSRSVSRSRQVSPPDPKEVHRKFQVVFSFPMILNLKT
jgi:hypothetical protein